MHLFHLFGLLSLLSLFTLLPGRVEGVPLEDGYGPLRVGGNRTLLIVDTLTIQYSHSMFLELLATQGHEINVIQADNENLILEEYYT